MLEPTGRLEFQKKIPGKMCKILSVILQSYSMWLPPIYSHFHLQDHPACHIPKHPGSAPKVRYDWTFQKNIPIKDLPDLERGTVDGFRNPANQWNGSYWRL